MPSQIAKINILRCICNLIDHILLILSVISMPLTEAKSLDLNNTITLRDISSVTFDPGLGFYTSTGSGVPDSNEFDAIHSLNTQDELNNINVFDDTRKDDNEFRGGPRFDFHPGLDKDNMIQNRTEISHNDNEFFYDDVALDDTSIAFVNGSGLQKDVRYITSTGASASTLYVPVTGITIDSEPHNSNELLHADTGITDELDTGARLNISLLSDTNSKYDVDATINSGTSSHIFHIFDNGTKINIDSYLDDTIIRISDDINNRIGKSTRFDSLKGNFIDTRDENDIGIASDNELPQDESIIIPSQSNSPQVSRPQDIDGSADSFLDSSTSPTTETGDNDNDDHYGKTTPEIIQSNGYPVEIHKVQTADGYILELHRIPNGKKNLNHQNLNLANLKSSSEESTKELRRNMVPLVEDDRRESRTTRKKQAVFLQHCLLCSSSDWVINKPDKSLGYILADNGYDVWLGNARGNTYSRDHAFLSPSDKKFWDFSWDEIAKYDIPASIDYVLKTTNSSKLNYVGFSMGTLVSYAMLSEKAEYNDKINVMVALGPVAFMGNMVGPLSYFTRYVEPIKNVAEFFGIREILSGGAILDFLTSMMCDPQLSDFAPFCERILLQMIGMDANYINKKILPSILSHTPAGTSLKNIVHFMQLSNSGRFQKYNYGSMENLKRYRSRQPPSYELKRTRIPVALYWAENDWFANPKDVAKLSKILPNVISNVRIPQESFSHVDFLWSDSAVDYIYKDVLRIFMDYKEK